MRIAIPPINAIRNCPIRYKLLISYSLAFFVVITLGSLVVNSVVRNTIENNIESELKNSTSAILNLVKTAASVSIKNYFRSAAEKNRDILNFFHQKYQKGELNLEEAKKQAGEILLSQTIGLSGYIYCVDSYGNATLHPNKAVAGENFVDVSFIQKIITDREVYVQYDWQNPGELKARSKAVYVAYFKPWDWFICVSAYQEEFNKLVDVDDFKEGILSFKFGKSGYAFLLDKKGEVVVHPKELVGQNYYNVADSDGIKFVQEMISKESGKIQYSWKNPGEVKDRNKVVIFDSIPQFNWIVASSGYLDEIYAPLQIVQNVITISGIISLFMVTFMTFWISSLITNPLREIMLRFALGAKGDLSVRVNTTNRDEIGQLAIYFNDFMEKLEQYNINLQKEVQERIQTEEALKLSEEMFSKAFQSSPNGIFITTLKDFRFINVNNSFIQFTGYAHDEIIEKRLDEVNIMPQVEDGYKMLEKLKKDRHLRNYEIEYLNKSGELAIGMVSAEIIALWDEPTVLATMEDITNRKRLEREVIEISEKERQIIGQNLHDDLCPHLIGIEVLTTVLEKQLAAKGLDVISNARKIRQLIGDAIDKTRTLSRGLCPVHLLDHGLDYSLQELATNTSKIYGIDCHFQGEASTISNDSITATQVLYITQEAVQNAIRHGKADQVNIELSSSDHFGRIVIKDNGSGITTNSKPTGMGMQIMKYRAKLIGAFLEVNSNQMGGTQIEVLFPEKPQPSTHTPVEKN